VPKQQSDIVPYIMAAFATWEALQIIRKENQHTLRSRGSGNEPGSIACTRVLRFSRIRFPARAKRRHVSPSFHENEVNEDNNVKGDPFVRNP